VWPFERRHDVLRVGRASAELWARTPAGLVRRDHEAITGESPDVAALKSGMRGVLARRAEGVQAVELVLESSWLPVLCIEPGRTLLARAQVESLLRHRLALLYGVSDASADAWSVQVEHRAGERQGLGYALRPSVKQALLDAAMASKCKVASIQPAFIWGRRHFGKRLPRDGWCLWQEQDRTLVVLFASGRVRALNGGAPVLRNAAQATRLVEVEALRQGQPNAAPTLVAAGWEPLRGARTSSPTMSWLCVAASTSEVPHAAPGGALQGERAA
jgi:hypothetical protein